LIDVQDALAGSPAYDLVSLLQDARIDVAVDEEQSLLARYLDMNDAAQASQFMCEYHLLGLQRNLKIAGIFHRLNLRDRKPAYLRHLPRIEAYIRRGLAQPHLQPVVDWLRLYAPQTELAEVQP
jgi:aminoglycoside/choline kinase family phosphotransferase